LFLFKLSQHWELLAALETFLLNANLAAVLSGCAFSLWKTNLGNPPPGAGVNNSTLFVLKLLSWSTSRRRASGSALDPMVSERGNIHDSSSKRAILFVSVGCLAFNRWDIIWMLGFCCGHLHVTYLSAPIWRAVGSPLLPLNGFRLLWVCPWFSIGIFQGILHGHQCWILRARTYRVESNQSRFFGIYTYRVDYHEDIRLTTPVKQLTSSQINNDPSS